MSDWVENFGKKDEEVKSIKFDIHHLRRLRALAMGDVRLKIVKEKEPNES